MDSVLQITSHNIEVYALGKRVLVFLEPQRHLAQLCPHPLLCECGWYFLVIFKVKQFILCQGKNSYLVNICLSTSLIYSLGDTKSALIKNTLRFLSTSLVVTNSGSSMNIKPHIIILFVGILIDICNTYWCTS